MDWVTASLFPVIAVSLVSAPVLLTLGARPRWAFLVGSSPTFILFVAGFVTAHFEWGGRNYRDDDWTNSGGLYVLGIVGIFGFVTSCVIAFPFAAFVQRHTRRR